MTWSPQPPVSFEPLDGANGVPGDPAEVAALARRYTATAEEIQTQASNLQRLSAQAAGGWKGKAGERFTDKSADLSARITRAQRRYEAAAAALQHFADGLAPIQTSAYSAVRLAQAAQEEARTLQAQEPQPSLSPLITPVEQAAEREASRLHASALVDAAGRSATAEREYEQAKRNYGDLARTAASLLQQGRSGDGMKDGWWDRNAPWIKTALKILGAVVLVLALAALVLSMFIPGWNVLVGGLLLSQLLNIVGATLTVVMLAGQVGMWRSGNGEFRDVLISLVGLASFGLGFGAGAAATRLGGTASRIGQGVAGARGGRAVFSARGLPGRMFDLGERLPTARRLLSLFPRIGSAFDGAADAATAARQGVAALTGRPVPLGARLLAAGDDSIAAAVSRISQINDAVPDVVRLEALEAAARGAAGVWSGVNVPQVGVAGFDVVEDFVLEPREEVTDSRELADTVRHWSMPLLHLR